MLYSLFTMPTQMGATSGAGTSYPSGAPEFFSGVHANRSLVVCVCFVEGCLSFFIWPLCCLSFCNLQSLITHLVSSNSSFEEISFKM